jgi:hypothetical protein
MKVAPEWLKPQECERNTGRSRPPIPYIPEKDVLQEAVDSSANTLKLRLSHKVELCIPVWSKGTPEQFLVHIQQAIDAIKDQEEWTKNLTRATEAYGNYKGRDENPPEKKAVDKATEAIPHEKESIKSLIAQLF